MGPEQEVSTSDVSGLLPNTTYYLRAYATNGSQTGYGNELTFTTFAATDIDGNNYTSIVIGSQTFLKENLKTTRYLNGDAIPTTTTDVSGEASPKYQWAYNDDEDNVSTYGRLYTWYTATDSRNICPTGWHVPSDAEWEALKAYLGGELVSGGLVKETGTTHWQTPNTGATNTTGFTALPAGYRTLNGSYASIGLTGPFWSYNENLSNTAEGLGQGLHYNDASMVRGGFDKPDGCSVRCMK